MVLGFTYFHRKLKVFSLNFLINLQIVPAHFLAGWSMLVWSVGPCQDTRDERDENNETNIQYQTTIPSLSAFLVWTVQNRQTIIISHAWRDSNSEGERFKNHKQTAKVTLCRVVSSEHPDHQASSGNITVRLLGKSKHEAAISSLRQRSAWQRMYNLRLYLFKFCQLTWSTEDWLLLRNCTLFEK